MSRYMLHDQVNKYWLPLLIWFVSKTFQVAAPASQDPLCLVGLSLPQEGFYGIKGIRIQVI